MPAVLGRTAAMNPARALRVKLAHIQGMDFRLVFHANKENIPMELDPLSVIFVLQEHTQRGSLLTAHPAALTLHQT